MFHPAADSGGGLSRLEFSLLPVAAGAPIPNGIALIAPGSGENARTTLFFRNREWEYRRCSTVRAEADGVVLEISESTHHGNIIQNGVAEEIGFEIPQASVERMAAAQRLSFHVCDHAFTPGPEMMEGLQDLARANRPNR